MIKRLNKKNNFSIINTNAQTITNQKTNIFNDDKHIISNKTVKPIRINKVVTIIEIAIILTLSPTLRNQQIFIIRTNTHANVYTICIVVIPTNEL